MTQPSRSSQVEIDALSFDGATLLSHSGAVVAVIDPDGNLEHDVSAALACGIVLGCRMTETLMEIQKAIGDRRGHLPPPVAKQLLAMIRDLADLFTRYEAIRP